MAWRPYENVIDGEIDLTEWPKVTGHINFVAEEGKPLHVTLELHEEESIGGESGVAEALRGKKILLKQDNPHDRNITLGRADDPSYMRLFGSRQRGIVGDIYETKSRIYIEWYDEVNGRVVLELKKPVYRIVDPSGVSA